MHTFILMAWQWCFCPCKDTQKESEKERESEYTSQSIQVSFISVHSVCTVLCLKDYFMRCLEFIGILDGFECGFWGNGIPRMSQKSEPSQGSWIIHADIRGTSFVTLPRSVVLVWKCGVVFFSIQLADKTGVVYGGGWWVVGGIVVEGSK